MKILYFTVTNELCFDQRMHRICSSLSQQGYQVHLVGRQRRQSPPMPDLPFRHHRLPCLFQRGKAFYVEFNLRLLLFLLFRRLHLVCAIDLDTILPVYLVSRIRGCQRVYDAHEWFPEMTEVVARPAIHRSWLALERFMVPRFPRGYTVSQPLADHFERSYGVRYAVVRNLPEARPWPGSATPPRDIIYQGDLNEGRCFERLIPAMREVRATLHIVGEGNFSSQARKIVKDLGLEEKVIFHGRMLPEELARFTPLFRVGITLFDPAGGSNRGSLANRFFDYIQAGVPQLCSAFEAYADINRRYAVAVLMQDTSPETIAVELNNLLENEVLYSKLRINCMEAARIYTWENESGQLMEWYQNLLR